MKHNVQNKERYEMKQGTQRGVSINSKIKTIKGGIRDNQSQGYKDLECQTRGKIGHIKNLCLRRKVNHTSNYKCESANKKTILASV